MASVRITEEIRSHVKMRIQNLFTKRIADKEKELQCIGLGDTFVRSVISPKAFELALQLNEDPDGKWIPETTQILMTIKYPDQRDSTLIRARTFWLEFKPPVPLPQRIVGQYGYKASVPSDSEAYAQAVKILTQLDSIERERDDLINELVGKVLVACTTLKQVLEVWPTAMEFMPSSAIERHNMKVESARSRVKRELGEVDDSVKMKLMKARMINGS